MSRFRWFMLNIEEIVGCLLILVMTFSVTLGVFARAFHISVVWTDELARYSFVWSIFIGSVVAIKQKEHVVIDFVLKALPEVLYKILYILIQLLLIVLFLYLTKYGIDLAIGSWGVETTSLEIPTGLVYLAVPLSSVLMIVYVIIDMWKTLRVDKNNHKSNDTTCNIVG